MLSSFFDSEKLTADNDPETDLRLQGLTTFREEGMIARVQTDALVDSLLLGSLKTTLKEDLHLQGSVTTTEDLQGLMVEGTDDSQTPTTTEEVGLATTTDTLQGTRDLHLMTDGKESQDLPLKTDAAIQLTLALIGTQDFPTDLDQDLQIGILPEASEVVAVVTETEALLETTETSEEVRTSKPQANPDPQEDTETTMARCAAALPDADEIKKAN